MNPRGFGFETTPQPPAAPAGDRREEDAGPAMRAAPEDQGDDQRGDDSDDEPGYGHGV